MIIILGGVHPSSNTFMIAVLSKMDASSSLIRALLREVSKEKTLSLIIISIKMTTATVTSGEARTQLFKGLNSAIKQINSIG